MWIFARGAARLQETGKIKTIPSYYIPKLFFEAIFENPSPKLDTVCIRMDKSTKLDGCVLDIAPYFSSHHHAEASKNRSLPIGTPYSGLKNIHIFGDIASEECGRALSSIILHQSGLVSLELMHTSSTISPKSILDQVMNVISQPQFQSL